ncbi:MAG: L,D-transpeptidase [Planctomycetes bacterium]|nr:L,D-transpeptidase [Planctomycetota bacterium]
MSHRPAPCVPVVLASILLLGACGRETAAGEGEADLGGFLRFEDSGGSEREAVSAAGAVEAAAPAAPNASPTDGGIAVGAPAASVPSEELELEQRASAQLASGSFAQAAATLSKLMLGHVAGGRDDRTALARWTALLAAAQAEHRWNPKGTWPATDVSVQSGDSLIAIRKRILEGRTGLLLCTGEIVRANRLASSTAIRPGALLRVPLQTPSMRVDLSAMWAFYCFGDEVAAAWEVGVGREGNATRPGTYTIGAKQENPMWTPAGREPVPFGDPQNPLGTRWLAWNLEGRGTALGFHGTNDPTSVGQRISDGCIRMSNRDVEQLFEILPVGAQVLVEP